MRRDATRGAGFSLTIETLAVHAGQGAGRAHGGRLAPDLPDVDVPPGWRGPADRHTTTPGRRTRPGPVRTRRRGPRGRWLGVAFAVGLGDDRRDRQGLADADSEIVVGDDVYGGPSVTSRRSAAQWRRAPLRPRRGPRGDVGALSEDPPRLVRDADDPLLKVVDIAGTAEVLRERFGEGPRPLVVVDSTFATPVLQRPLDLARTSSSTRRRSTSRATATRSLASP